MLSQSAAPSAPSCNTLQGISWQMYALSAWCCLHVFPAPRPHRGVVPTTQRAMILTATQFATYDEVGSGGRVFKSAFAGAGALSKKACTYSSIKLLWITNLHEQSSWMGPERCSAQPDQVLVFLLYKACPLNASLHEQITIGLGKRICSVKKIMHTHFICPVHAAFLSAMAL